MSTPTSASPGSDGGSIERERRAIREGALVRPAPELGTIVVTGRDRQSWLNGMVTCDLAPLRPGDGAYGLAVAKNGKVLAELWLVLAEDRLSIGLLADRVEAMRAHFDRHVIMEDVELEDASAELAWILLHGPMSPDVALPLRSASVHAASVDRTGLGGAAVVAPRADADALARRLVEAAGERGALSTDEGWEQLRVEVGVPRFGVDFDDQNYPQEAGLERAGVSFTKGCYLGQETVFMLEKRGHVKKRLVRLEVQGDASLPVEAEIAEPGGAPIGAVTSRAPAPDGGAVLALGYVKYKHARTGTELVVAGRPARVVGGGVEP